MLLYSRKYIEFEILYTCKHATYAQVAVLLIRCVVTIYENTLITAEARAGATGLSLHLIQGAHRLSNWPPCPVTGAGYPWDGLGRDHLISGETLRFHPAFMEVCTALRFNNIYRVLKTLCYVGYLLEQIMPYRSHTAKVYP